MISFLVYAPIHRTFYYRTGMFNQNNVQDTRISIADKAVCLDFSSEEEDKNEM